MITNSFILKPIDKLINLYTINVAKISGGGVMKVISILLILGIFLSGVYSKIYCQVYPERQINLVIPMAPGDGVDIAGRLMAEELSKLLKVPIVVLNKPGAGGGIGTDFVTKAKNDGYTILLTPSAPIIYNRILNPSEVPYDSFKDLTPIALTTHTPIVIAIRSDAPFKDFREFVDFAKKNPGKIRIGTMGIGSVGDFDTEIIKSMVNINITSVPFKGASPAITALLGGHVEAVAVALGPLIAHIRAGKVKGILISTTFPEFPEIPTLKQSGYKQDLLGVWFAFFGPARLPEHIKNSLVPIIEKVVKDPTISSRLAKAGMIQEFEPPDKLFQRMQEEYKTADEIAKLAGLKR